MSYSKYYNPTNWENYPSEDTAINAARLNNIEDGVDTLDDRIVELSTDKSEVDWNQMLIAGRKIAEITINGITKDVLAPEDGGGGGGSTVTITPTISTGTKIADYVIDGYGGSLYAPNGGGGASALDDLTDVDLTTPSNGQVLKYDSANSKWINANESGGGASLPIDISSSSNVTGILNVANGGTGNADGYIRVGNRSGETIGQYATVEGHNNKASDYGCHAEGDGCSALGLLSHAEGNGCMASGNYSHAEGQGTSAAAHYQHAQGRWNVLDNSNTYAHIVGNGTNTNNRSNCHTLDWSGNAWFAGTVTDGTGNVLSSKQDALPTAVNDRYLHTNASTGALEWAQVQGGGSSATILTSTLTAGQTTITFTNAAITSTALIDIYTDDPDVGWESRSVSSTTLTIVFPVQASDLSVKVRIEESGV